jgi:hypothetical protein
MKTFWEWLSDAALVDRLRVIEANHGLDPKSYAAMLNGELYKAIARASDAKQRRALEKMRDFDWLGYIHSLLANDDEEMQESGRDIATRVLLSTPFTGVDVRSVCTSRREERAG